MRKHIEILHPQDCCGCTACMSICPKQCIRMQSDALGFQYPKVDTSLCIECGLCEGVCPFAHSEAPLQPKSSYAATNQNIEERLKSSSGGIFLKIAQVVIKEGGIVFGAVFDENWNVKHVAAYSMDDVRNMMGSKYTQSRLDTCYRQAKSFLTDGKRVLFTGTPCQIAGLKHFLRKEYTNLICIEVICHGVPAPLSWQKSIRETKQSIMVSDSKNYLLKSASFRDKRKGWRNFGLSYLFADCNGLDSDVEVYQSFQKNSFMQAFLNNWSLRPSCYNCKAKSGKSHADFTIGDFWGIEHVEGIKDDDKGMSCIICRTPKGEQTLKEISGLELTLVGYESILHQNKSIERSVDDSSQARCFKKIISFLSLHKTMELMKKGHIVFRLTNFIERRFKKQ